MHQPFNDQTDLARTACP